MATLSWTSTSHTHLCTVQCSAVESTVKPMSCLPRRTRALVRRGKYPAFAAECWTSFSFGCCSAESYSQILWGFVHLSQPYQRFSYPHLVTNTFCTHWCHRYSFVQVGAIYNFCRRSENLMCWNLSRLWHEGILDCFCIIRWRPPHAVNYLPDLTPNADLPAARWE